MVARELTKADIAALVAELRSVEKPEPLVVAVTVVEAAEALRVSDDTVYRLIGAGDLDVCDVSPSTSKRAKFRVPVASLQALVEKRSTNAREQTRRSA